MAKSRVVRIQCKTADEAASIQRAVDLPDVRAFLSIVGTLEPLSSRARVRVLQYVKDKLAEDEGSLRIETSEPDKSDKSDGRSIHVVARGPRSASS